MFVQEGMWMCLTEGGMVRGGEGGVGGNQREEKDSRFCRVNAA